MIILRIKQILRIYNLKIKNKNENLIECTNLTITMKNKWSINKK